MNVHVNSITEPVLVCKDRNETIPYTRIVVPSSMRSPLWRYFGFPADDNYVITNRKKIVCTICHTQIAYNKNTTNLSTHLHCRHPSVYAKFYPSVVPSKKADVKTEAEQAEQAEYGERPKRVKFDEDVDWHVDEHTQIDPLSHPTGIRAKEAIRNGNDSANVLNGDHAKPTVIKKSTTLDEDFELVISTPEANNDGAFTETLEYSDNYYMELVADDYSDIVGEPEHLVVEATDAEKSEFSEPRERCEIVTVKATERCGTLKVKASAVLQAPKSNGTDKSGVEENSAASLDITGQLKRFLVKDIVPVSILDGAGFRELIQSLARNMPTSAEVEESLVDDYKQQYMDNVANIKDLMSKRHYSLSFEQLAPFGAVLYAISINNLAGADGRYETLESHIICVSQSVGEFFDSFEILSTKCSAFVLNVDSDDEAIDLISTYAKEKEIPVIQTFSSIINDAVLACMRNPEVEKALDAVELNEKCTETDWLEQYEYLSQLLESSLAASNEFLPTIERFLTCLHPLKNCLDVLALESLTFASLMKPIALELLNQHYKQSDIEAADEDPLELTMKQTIFKVLQEKIIENEFLATASFLDPRFQGLTLPDDLASIRAHIEKSLNTADTATNKPQSLLKSEKVNAGRGSGLSSLFASIGTGTKSKMPRNRFDMEFRSYTEDVTLDMDQCPLAWWSESELLYPNIKRYVGEYFCVPAFADISPCRSSSELATFRRRCATLTTDTDRMTLWLHLNQPRRGAGDESA